MISKSDAGIFTILKCYNVLCSTRPTHGGCRDKPYLVIFAPTLVKPPLSTSAVRDGLSSFKARSISFTLLLSSHDLGAMFRHLMPSPLSRYPISPPKTPCPSLTRWSFETYSKPYGSSKSAQAVAESRTKNSTDVSSPSKSLRGRDSFRKIYRTLYGAGIAAHAHTHTAA